MSHQNFGPDVDVATDPFQLERLAEELASRESEQSKQFSHPPLNEGATPDLPIYVPLSHDNPYLKADTFNVEDFLLSRSYTSLPDLRAELRDYLSILKEELVKLINDDYEAFISLSTDLKDEGERLERLKSPLSGLKSDILVGTESRRELQAIQDAIQDKLRKRATLREEKAILHLLLKISESVTRLESLLLIAPPIQDTNQPIEVDGIISPTLLPFQDDEVTSDRTELNKAKYLARVAAEYTQLSYHTSKARSDNCKYVEELQWRIDRIRSTLSSDLDHLFSSTLIALVEGKGEIKMTEIEKSKLVLDLTECLRIYDVLGLWRDAEDVLRRDVVRKFVKKTIFPNALVAPHSPILPHTPFQSSAVPSFLMSSLQDVPRTPYTPYSAFASKQNPFQTAYSPTTSSPYLHLLDDKDDPLAKLYNQVLRFVERDLCRIMDITEKVSIKSFPTFHGDKKSGPLFPVSSNQEASRKGFEIMANVVWAEFATAIMDELGSVVFAVGKPAEFRKNYEISQAFIRALECLAPSIESIVAMRAHPAYTTFQRRWQLPVYFQLRWKDIVGKLEPVFNASQVEPHSAPDHNGFLTSQAAASWTAISTCWSAEVYIPELCHRFWRLTLQVLSRYRTWLDLVLPSHESGTHDTALSTDQIPGSPAGNSRVSTPNPQPEAASAENTAADDAILRQFATVISDIEAIRSHLFSLWRQEISMMLPESSNLDDDSLENALEHSVSSLASLIPLLSAQIITILTRRCCDSLLPVRSIPSQFRAMSNKRMPMEPSYFIQSILRPLKVFFGIGTSDAVGASLKSKYIEIYASEVCEGVCQRFVSYLTAMKKTEESLRRLKKGKKSTFSLFGGSGSARDDDTKDEERIRTQMILDVEALGNDAQSLGVKLDKAESFQLLSDLVHATIPDE